MKRLSRHYNGKQILLTGHTGFKGSWMAEWLLSLGARVAGIALEPDTEPAIFNQLALEDRLEHHLFDIRDNAKVADAVQRIQPDIIFHLAAQPLVRYSYGHPLETFETNVMGTAHILDALRRLDKPCQAVIVTTDKCYENRETDRPYVEEDPMGGFDPYSASKGAAELVVSAYRRSFFNPERYGVSHQVAVASARAGNVIGGGDWAHDRILPDCIRRISKGLTIPIRNPKATRPWQHVLEPVGGYLMLAMRLAEASDVEARQALFSGFNFGPAPDSNRSVSDLVEQVLQHWPGEWEDCSDPDAVHEATLLSLAIGKAEQLLGWKPVWNFETTVERTVNWYQQVLLDPACAHGLTVQQITEYMERLEHDL